MKITPYDPNRKPMSIQQQVAKMPPELRAAHEQRQAQQRAKVDAEAGVKLNTLLASLGLSR